MSAWIKLWVELLDDGKFAALPEASQLAAIKLFLVAGTVERAMLPSDDETAWILHMSTSELAERIGPLMDAGILKRKKGRMFVTHFEDRQKCVSHADRQRHYRARLSRDDSSHQSHGVVTDGVTKRRIEVEVEVEGRGRGRGRGREEGEGRKRHPPTRIPPAVEIYHEKASRYPAKSLWQAMDEAIGQKPMDLDLWGDVVHGWIAHGWNPLNFSGMFEYFKRGEPPKANGRRAEPEPEGDPLTGGIRQ